MTSMTLEDLSSQLKKIDFCMLSTNAGSGRISSRPMSNNGDVEYDGDSWFFSYDDTRKIAEIEGIASLVRDKATFEKHWVADLERWFPEGIDTPGLVLIKVSASSIQYWDGEENGEVTLAASSSRS